MDTVDAKTLRRNKRLVQGDRSREEILDAASALMSSRGYSGTSMSELAKLSGLPVSSIYWHFESKAGVLAAVMERGAHRFFADTVTTDALNTPDPQANLAAMMDHSARTMHSHPEFLRLLMLLMLGSEGEHAQEEAVLRVRRQGRDELRRGLLTCYAPWGEEAAARVADQLAGPLMALVDGAFIAGQAGDGLGVHLLDQIVAVVHVMAEGLRSPSAAPGRS